MTYFRKILTVLGASTLVLLGSWGAASATTTFIVQQGGTGATTFTSSNLLYGAGTNPIGSVATTSVTCTGSTTCTSFTAIGSSPITINSTGGGTVTQINTTWPVIGGPITTTGTLSFGGLSTSSPIAAGAAILYATGVNTLASTATSTLTGTGPISVSNTPYIIGGSGAVISCTNASSGVTGCLTGTDWNTFNNKGSGSVTSITAGDGLLGGVVTTSGTIYGQVGTSTTPVIGRIPYWSTLGTATAPAKLDSVATSSIGVSAGLTNSGTLGSQIGGSALTLKQVENRSFGIASSSWGSGTTTLSIESGYGELWNYVRCWTVPNGSTVDVDFYWNSNSTANHLNFLIASSTNGQFSFTTNATITAGATTTVDIGTAAGSPTRLACTVNDTI